LGHRRHTRRGGLDRGPVHRLEADFGTLWRDPGVPDRLREEALHEILARLDVRGSEIVAIHPAPNENAWLLGQAEFREGSFLEDV
jgi:hypothetical protein